METPIRKPFPVTEWKSDGSVGGYKYGTNKKISLLKKEGVRIKGKKVVFSS